MPEEVGSSGTENAGATAETTGSTSPTPSSGVGGALASLQKAAAAASSAASPDGTSGAPSDTGVGTTVQPGQPGANSGATGEDAAWLAIPEDRKARILDNTRQKIRDEVTQEFEGKYGWAKDLTPDVVQNAFSFASRMNDNPVGFAIQLIGELSAYPQALMALKEALAPLFAPGAGNGNGNGNGHAYVRDGRFTLPQGRLASEDGKARAFSEDQVGEILQNFESHIMDQLSERFGPLENFHETLTEREAVMNVIHETRQEGAALMEEMRGLKHWPQEWADAKGNIVKGPHNPGEQKIAVYLNAIPADVKKRLGAYGSMMRAFQTFLENDVLPTLEHKNGQQVRDDLRRKAAAAAGSVQPGNVQPPPPMKKPQNVNELARHMEKLAAGAG